jgi:hypothetical protein
VQVLLVPGHILAGVQTVWPRLDFVMVRRRDGVVGKEDGVYSSPLFSFRGRGRLLLSSAELPLLCLVEAVRGAGFLKGARSRSTLMCSVQVLCAEGLIAPVTNKSRRLMPAEEMFPARWSAYLAIVKWAATMSFHNGRDRTARLNGRDATYLTR